MVRENLERVREKIRAAAAAGGRDPRPIRLVAVTKGVAVDNIEEAVASGIEEIGENRVQEAQQKKIILRQAQDDRVIQWHLIGHLQRNKVKPALGIFDWIQSVDRPELVEAIDRAAAELDRPVNLFVEVDVTGISTRTGASPAEVPSLVQRIRKLPRLHLKGLMTMAPYAEDPETVRPVFRQVKELAQQCGLEQLSMGMSHDFEVAIQEGATMVRIGTAIFGE